MLQACTQPSESGKSSSCRVVARTVCLHCNPGGLELPAHLFCWWQHIPCPSTGPKTLRPVAGPGWQAATDKRVQRVLRVPPLRSPALQYLAGELPIAFTRCVGCSAQTQA